MTLPGLARRTAAYLPRLEDALRRCYPVALACANWRIPIFRLQGITRAGCPGTVLVAGQEPWVNYLPSCFFSTVTARELLEGNADLAGGAKYREARSFRRPDRHARRPDLERTFVSGRLPGGSSLGQDGVASSQESPGSCARKSQPAGRPAPDQTRQSASASDSRGFEFYLLL